MVTVAVEGLTVAYSADTYSVAASFEGGNGANLDTDDMNIELAASFTGVENLSLGLGYFIDNNNDQDIVNVHAAYGLGKTTSRLSTQLSTLVLAKMLS